MMRWWLDKGVDGFRMDVINMISKAPGLPDAPVTTAERYQSGGQYFIHGPRLLEFLGRDAARGAGQVRHVHGRRDADGDAPSTRSTLTNERPAR